MLGLVHWILAGFHTLEKYHRLLWSSPMLQVQVLMLQVQGQVLKIVYSSRIRVQVRDSSTTGLSNSQSSQTMTAFDTVTPRGPVMKPVSIA
jgi:hypothetical protein